MKIQEGKMKKIPLLVLLLIPPALFCVNPVFAEGDSCTIVVTCAVPAVPGVNAPALLEQETLKPASTGFAETIEHPREESPGPSFATIANEEVGEVELPEGETSLMLVRTIYPR
jgi:hypothetical protein